MSAWKPFGYLRKLDINFLLKSRNFCYINNSKHTYMFAIYTFVTVWSLLSLRSSPRYLPTFCTSFRNNSITCIFELKGCIYQSCCVDICLEHSKENLEQNLLKDNLFNNRPQVFFNCNNLSIRSAQLNRYVNTNWFETK